MFQKTLMTYLILLLSIIGFSQNNPLDHYVEVALKNNLSLKSQQLTYKKSQVKLKEIKGNYIPALSFQTRYSRAFGGRTFEIPVGDLLNPVFQNLNLLNASITDPTLPTMPVFGNAENEDVNFLRRKEQVSYMRVVFPIFNPTLNQGKQLHEHQLKIEQENLNLFQKDIVAEVKKSYYNFLKIKAIQKSLANAKSLVEENLKTAQSLFEHHKVTIDYVYSAEVEIKSVEKEIAEVNQKEQLAKAYFNLLLNQPITTEIKFSETEVPINQNTLSLEEAITLAKNNRLEFNQMDIASSMADQKIKMEKADKLPQLNFVGDYGFQGENYSFGSEDDYAMASVILSWNILEASHGPKVEQAKIDKELLIFQKEALRKKIELEVLGAFYDAETALKNIDLAKTKKESATKAYRVINKKFKQGQANLLEINNALTQLTDADQEIIISQFNYQIKFLAFEKAIGK